MILSIRKCLRGLALCLGWRAQKFLCSLPSRAIFMLLRFDISWWCFAREIKISSGYAKLTHLLSLPFIININLFVCDTYCQVALKNVDIFYILNKTNNWFIINQRLIIFNYLGQGLKYRLCRCTFIIPAVTREAASLTRHLPSQRHPVQSFGATSLLYMLLEKKASCMTEAIHRSMKLGKIHK